MSSLTNDFVAAAALGDVGKLSQLLEQGVDINGQNTSGWTALKQAVVNDQMPAAEFLLEKGAKTSIPGGPKKFFPLHNAVDNSNIDMVRLLLRYGARVDATDAEGKLAFDHANERNMRDISRLLIDREKVGAWRKTGPDEIVYTRYIPEADQKRVEVFSFGQRYWTLTIQNTQTKQESTVMRTFDEFKDPSMIKIAAEQLKSRGGTPDASALAAGDHRHKHSLLPPKKN